MEAVNIRKMIIRLSIPVAIQIIFKTSIGFADNVMIGQYGEGAIAGVGASNQLIFLLMMVFSSIGMGVGIFAAQCVGAKDMAKLKLTSGTALFSGVIFGTIFTGVFIMNAEYFLKMIGAKDAILENGTIYLKIVSLTIIPMLLTFVFTGIFRAFHDNKSPMYASLAAMIINIVLNYIFIIKMKKGVVGAGIATVIASYLEIIIMIFFIEHKKEIIKIEIKDLLKFSKEVFFKLVKIGWPISVDTMIWRISSLVMVSIILKLGIEAAGANEILKLVQSLMFIPIGAIATTISAMVGQKIGEKDYINAKKIVNEGVKIAFVFILIGSFILIPFSNIIPQFFKFTETTREIAFRILIFFGFLQLNVVWNGIYPNILRAGGDTKIIIWITTVNIWLIGIPLSYFLGVILKMGLYGVVIGYTIAEFTKAYFFYKRFASGKWMKKLI